MSLLTPLGLLGLLGIVALIIIYIIKPNYQNKFISSTFIWKLSLKYKKKKIPISKLRNILIFICQLIILTATAFILAQPFLNSDKNEDPGDVIMIIDASASMHSQVNQQTRIERAADAALADAKKALDNGQQVTVILASDTASFLVQQASKDQAQLVYDAFESISVEPESVYTYGTPDIDGAMKLAEQITSYTTDVSITLYTDTNYLDAGNINVYNVSDTSEWNAAILDVRATIVENYYRIEIDVASYGADSRLAVECEIFNVNDTDTSLQIEKDVYCSNDEVTTLVLGYISEDMPTTEADLIDENISVFAYDHIYVHISQYDSLDYDNQFHLYGGKKPTLKVQYFSALPNNYWSSALLVLQDVLKDRWTLEITEVNPNAVDQKVAIEGYDIYIFEHTMPNTIPSDGVVICSNPQKLPSEAGVRFGNVLSSNGGEIFLSSDEYHPIMKNIDATKISVTQFTSIISSDGYTPVVCYEDYPLMMVKEDIDQKIVLMPFSLHYSNLAVLPEFPLLLKNVIEHFFPVTIEDHVFEIGDTVTINARSSELNLTGPSTNLTLDVFPSEFSISMPGTYSMTQMLMSGYPLIESIYARIPAAESNICLTEDTLTNPYFFEKTESNNIDLLFYFALAVVVLLFLEWWLKSREQI